MSTATWWQELIQPLARQSPSNQVVSNVKTPFRHLANKSGCFGRGSSSPLARLFLIRYKSYPSKRAICTLTIVVRVDSRYCAKIGVSADGVLSAELRRYGTLPGRGIARSAFTALRHGRPWGLRGSAVTSLRCMLTPLAMASGSDLGLIISGGSTFPFVKTNMCLVIGVRLR